MEMFRQTAWQSPQAMAHGLRAATNYRNHLAIVVDITRSSNAVR